MSKGHDGSAARPRMGGTTAPFHTLDPVDSAVLDKALDLLAAPASERAWDPFFADHPHLQHRLGSTSTDALIELDDATVLFLLAMQRMEDGSRLEVADGRHIERFGRFPSEDGCLLTYLLAWIRPTQGLEVEHDHLASLLLRLSQGIDNDHPNAAEGAGGLRLHGWLSTDDVRDLRTLLMGRCWTVSAEEPLDGGMRDAVMHLTALLRGAERRRVGLLHRSHA